MNTNRHLLDVQRLKTNFHTFEGLAKAVENVSFHMDEGETVGLVGESGCGKSVTALSIMRLIKNPPGKIVGGQIFFEGADLLKLSESRMRAIRDIYANPRYPHTQALLSAVPVHDSALKARELFWEMMYPAPSIRRPAVAFIPAAPATWISAHNKKRKIWEMSTGWRAICVELTESKDKISPQLTV